MMQSLIKFCLAILMILTSAMVSAGDKPNLLIMSEDSARNAIESDSPVTRRVINALTNQMHDIGFDVYDESILTAEGFAQGRTRRSDIELVDIARSVERPPIDVVVLFSLFADAESKGYTTKIKTRIEGRMLNVHTGQRLGNFEVASPKALNAKPDCNRNCLLEIVGDNAKKLANEAGSVLGQKLDWMVNGEGKNGEAILASKYTLTFENFDAQDRMDIEEYLVIFSGYQSHRVVEAMSTSAEYLYQSSIGTAKLNRNLNKMLKHLDMRGTVNFSGNTFTIKQVKLRGYNRKGKDRDWD